nr:threonine-phosphate decarboxylase CobD [Acuticoccus kandeliae]
MIHGGDLAEAKGLAGGRPVLDLSTGINPHAYPARASESALTRLPQRAALDTLLAAARPAYRVPDGAAIAAAPGTQAILQWLPLIAPARRVAIVGPTYQEHEAVWSRHAETVPCASLEEAADAAADTTVVVNPNNPDGRRHTREALAAFLSRARRADDVAPALIVDEAFADVTPGISVAGLPGTLVLKSFGKFYGLAGIRLGFAIGAPGLVGRLTEALGPWAVGGPALEIGAAALADTAWADAMRARLDAERQALDATLTGAGLTPIGGTDLYRLVATPDAARWHKALAAEGIWTRAFPAQPTWLRFGLPGDGLPRLAAALDAVTAGIAS